MAPLLPLRDGVRTLPISSFRQSMPSFYMNAPDCICSPGRLPLGAFCAGRDDLERESLHDDRISIRAPRAGCDKVHAPRPRRSRDRLRRPERSENVPRCRCALLRGRFAPRQTFFEEKTGTPVSGTDCIDYRILQKIGLPKRKTEQRSFPNMKATGIVRRIDD